MSSFAGVFSNRSFSLFYVGQALSFVGDGLRLVALPLFVYDLTHSAFAVGVTYALELGPFAIFSLVGGSLADRVDRRRLMIACDFVRFATLAVFALGAAFGFLKLWMVYAGISTIAIAAAVFIGGQSSTIPYLLGKERATQAYSALIAAEQTSNMIFLSVGGALYTEIGPLVAFTINAFTYLCSQLFIARVDTFGPDEPARVPHPGHVIADVALGFRFLLQDAAMRTVAGNSLVFNFFGFMTGAVFIPFLKVDFHASGTIIGLGFGMGAFCALLGTSFAGHAPKQWKFGQMMIVAYALDGVLFIPVMLTHNLAVALAFFAITNGVVVFEISQIIGWRIRVTPEDMVGRVTAAARLVALCGTVPGALIGGWLGDHHGPRSAIIVSGIGYLVMAALVGLSPAMRREAR